MTKILFYITFGISTALYSIAYADDLPDIRPGMWEATFEISSDGASKMKKMTAKQCYGERESIQELFNKAKEALKGQCNEMQVSSSNSSYTSTVTCDLGISKLTVKVVASGDFQTAYSMQSTSTFTPPMFGQSTQTTSGKGRYLGPCEPGTKVGDIITEDGKKVNINDMGKMPDLSPAQRKQIAEHQAKAAEMMKNIDPKQLQQMQQLMQQLGKQ